jgi:hypothetical protein
MDPNKIHHKSSNSFDIRCSISCTRAGVAALILATIAMSMSLSYRDLKPFIAFGEYVSLRFSLVDNLEMLEEDPCWKDLVSKDTKEPPERWPFTKLLDYKCNAQPLGIVTNNETPSKDKNRQKKSRDEENKSSEKIYYQPPPPPTMLRIATTLTGVKEIANNSVKLFDDQFLSLARSFRHKFDRSIYKWQIYRDRLITEEGGYPIKGRAWGQWKIEGGRISFFDKISKDEPSSIFEHLTFEKIKLLAKYELPTYAEFEQHRRKFTNITIPFLALPMTFYTGSIFVEFGLCFVLIYFWLFQCESKTSEAYPTPGTLFGVFGRRQLNHIILLILIAFPPIAAMLLAVMSYSLTRLNIIPAVIINIVSILIAYETRNLSKNFSDNVN